MRFNQKACWQGCSRGFVQHAVRLRNGLRMQAQMRPARAWRSRWWPHLQAMQRGQRAFWLKPSGNGCRRRSPVLQLQGVATSVAPLRRVAAPGQSTPAARSHSQIDC